MMYEILCLLAEARGLAERKVTPARRILLLLLGLALWANGAPAQVGPPIFQLSFSNPGARSLGFGGAFVALADDATAAFANPAGLVQLTRPEVSVEGRQWGYSTPLTVGGRISGQPTGILLDGSPGPRTGVSSNDVSGLSFLSFVYPGKKWSLAIYRHQLANFELDWQTEGFFGEFPPEFPGPRLPDFRVALDFELETWAASVAYRVTENLSLGLGLARFSGSFRLDCEVFFSGDEVFGPISYSPERAIQVGFLDGSGSDLGLNAGFLLKISERWNLGGFYRQGPRLDLAAEERVGPGRPDLPEGMIIDQALGASIRLPDVYGLGVAFRSETYTVSFEWDRVEYSTIYQSLDADEFDSEDDGIADGDELHLGFEYVFVRSKPLLALRAGAWLDPDHQVRSTGNALERAVFRGGDDEMHYSLGVGIVWQKIQIDLAADFSDLVDTVSVSAIYGF